MPPFKLRAAEALADEVDILIRLKVIGARSPAADALRDYRDPPRVERSRALASTPTAPDAEEVRLLHELERTLRREIPPDGDGMDNTCAALAVLDAYRVKEGKS